MEPKGIACRALVAVCAGIVLTAIVVVVLNCCAPTLFAASGHGLRADASFVITPSDTAFGRHGFWAYAVQAYGFAYLRLREVLVCFIFLFVYPVCLGLTVQR